MRENNPELKRPSSPDDRPNKKVRVSLTRNSCLYFKANTSLENPAPFEATKMPAKSVYKTPPTPAVNQGNTSVAVSSNYYVLGSLDC